MLIQIQNLCSIISFQNQLSHTSLSYTKKKGSVSKFTLPSSGGNIKFDKNQIDHEQMHKLCA